MPHPSVHQTTRTVHVGAHRLPRWVDGFGERHGAFGLQVSPSGVVLTAADGASAELLPPLAPWPIPDRATDVTPGSAEVIGALVDHVLLERMIGLLLIRRGGYACAVIKGDRVVSSKVGTRYVQSRTAAGGWSQQRFARRRENQANALVGAVADVAARLMLTPGTPEVAMTDALVTGGDRPLVDQVLKDSRLGVIGQLPRLMPLEVADPRADVVRGVPALLRSVRILLVDPPG